MCSTPTVTKNLSAGHFGKPEDNTRVRHDRVRPFLVSRLPQQLKILGAHLDIDLNGSFHAPCIDGLRLSFNVTKSTIRTRHATRLGKKDSDASLS